MCTLQSTGARVYHQILKEVVVGGYVYFAVHKKNRIWLHSSHRRCRHASSNGKPGKPAGYRKFLSQLIATSCTVNKHTRRIWKVRKVHRTFLTCMWTPLDHKNYQDYCHVLYSAGIVSLTSLQQSTTVCTCSV